MAEKKGKQEGNPSGGVFKAATPSVKDDVRVLLKTTSMHNGGRVSSKFKGKRKVGSHGKGLTKTGGYVSGPTTSRMPSMYYHPLYEETNIQLPREPREINQWCFVPEIKVLMRDGTERRIDEIIIGEQVITHTGSIGQVTNVWVREIDEDINVIKSVGNEELKCTDGHEIFVYKRDDIKCKHNYAKETRRCRPNQTQLCNKKDCEIKDLPYYKKVQAATLEKGDCLFTPIPQYENISEITDKKFLRLLGYYVAEGCIDYTKYKKKKYPMSVVFTINIKEKDTLGKEISDLCECVYNKKPVSFRRKDRKTLWNIRLDLAKAARDMIEYSKALAKNKTLSLAIMDLPYEYQREVMETMLMGDGSVRKECDSISSRVGSISLTTASDNLNSQFKVMAGRCGAVATSVIDERYCEMICTQENGRSVIAHNKESKNGKVYTAYNVAMSAQDTKKLFPNLVPFELKLKKPTMHRFFWKDKIISPIKSIKKEHYKGKVYNLEVYNVDIDEGGNGVLVSRDHSYVANGVAVGNSRHFYKCITPDSEVLMADGKVKLLSDIGLGDKVITHTGRTGKVNEIFDREISEDVYKVYTENDKSLIATKQHPFFVIANGDVDPRFLHAEELRVGDSVLKPIVGELYDVWDSYKIIKIEKFDYTGRIMNLNIEGEDNSFIANDMAVHNTDPIVATGLDFHSQFPITAFYNEMPESDSYIEKYYNELAYDLLKLKYVMLYISHEYWVLGNVFPFAEWDENEGRWNRIILINPDYISISGSALAGDPKIEMMADQRIQNIVNTRQPRDVFESLPKELVARVSRGEKIPLHPDHVTHIAHKLNYYDEYGTPIMYRLFKILMYKDRLREAQFAIAERHITPLQIWKLGEKGNEANEDDIAYFQQILDQVYADRNAAIVYGHYLDYSVVGSSGQIVPLNTEFEYIEKEILFGLGLSANIITGEGNSFSQPLVALESLINRYLLFREMLSNYIQEKIYKPVAEAQGFIKKDKASGREYLLYPRIKWSKMNLRDDVQQKQILMQLRQQKNVSAKTALDALGLSYETEKKNLEEEMMTIFNPNVQALKSQEALKPVLPNIPPLVDRQKQRKELGAKWKDYLELSVDNALVEKVERGEISREDADKIRQDIIKEVTLEQSISILKQIEDSVTSEFEKSISSGDVTKEEADKAKHDIIREIAKEYQIPGFGALTEILEQVNKNIDAQVEAGILRYDEAENVKREAIMEVAYENMDRIVEAALNNYKLIKMAREKAMQFRVGIKVNKLVKIAKVEKNDDVVDVVEEVVNEMNSKKDDGPSEDFGD